MLPINKTILGSGFLLMGGGSILALARNIPAKIWGAIRNQFTVSVDMDSSDELFSLVCLWLDQHPYSRKSRSIRANLVEKKSNELPLHHDFDGPDEEKKVKALIFTPARGMHFFWNQGKPLWMSRTKEDNNPNQNSLVKLLNKETITIYTIGRSQARLRKILEECVSKANDTHTDSISLYTNHYSSWTLSCRCAKRDPETLILRTGLWEQIYIDCLTFFRSRKVYAAKGIPWRRGYLLKGIPGSGKSSLVLALAGHLDAPIYTLSLSAETSDADVAGMFRGLPIKCIVLIEDIDALFAGRKKSTEKSNLSFSGLLNALDGVGSSEGRLLFMTTNHPEKLDKALIRPGRVDVQVEFSYATKYQLHKLYKKINPSASSEDVNGFVSSFKRQVSMAEAQEKALQTMDR